MIPTWLCEIKILTVRTEQLLAADTVRLSSTYAEHFRRTEVSKL